MFGDKLKSTLQNLEISQVQLSEELGVTQQAVNRWCNNITEPDHKMIVNIANHLKVSTDYLLGNEKKTSEKEEELKEKEILKKILIKSGYMKKGEDLTNEELKRLMEFVKINKKYIREIK